ncbi:glycosyltransferase family 2 protein [Apiospora arundinis]
MRGARARGFLAVVVSLLAPSVAAQDRWCGKAYKAGSPLVNPGGRLEPPSLSSTPLLDLKITPRHSLYVASDEGGEFIIDAPISYVHGSPWSCSTDGTAGQQQPDRLKVAISWQNQTLATGSIEPNTTDNIIPIDLKTMEPRMEGYPITLTATSRNSGSTFSVTTELFLLPEKSTGSVVKIDNLYGSLLYRNPATNGVFLPVFPYGFYGDYSGYLNKSASNIEKYVSQGYNVINVVNSFADDDMSATIKTMDRLNLLFQYDMRGSYKNLSSIAWQVPLVKDHPSLLTWYTADEPDGWQDPLDAPKQAYDLIASLDRYHPTALVLNCQNYHFKEYSSGADIIMEDAYPVGINATYAKKWGTPCNETFGDCGCDNCEGTLLDVPNRVDDFHNYQAWLGGTAMRKPVWAVPQAFSIPEDYWSRDPTSDEAWAMDMMAFNHGAKARLAWLYPVSTELDKALSKLSKVVTASPVMDFLTGANPVLLQDGKHGGLDVAYWKNGDQILVSVVAPGDSAANVGIPLPAGIQMSRVVSTPWGGIGWTLDGTTLRAKGGLPSLATSLIILQ